MDRAEVNEFVRTVQPDIEQRPQMNEAMTRATVIRPPFLNLLDWRVPDSATVEYPVSEYKNSRRVDYALVIDNTPLAFIEAKGLHTDLVDNHREQIKYYMRNEGVNLGILTNGAEFEFFRRKIGDNSVDIQTIGPIQLDALPSRYDVLEIYEKKKIEQGESEQKWEAIKQLESTRQTLIDNKNEIAKKVSDVIVSETTERIRTQSRSKAARMLDELREYIDGELSDTQMNTDVVIDSDKYIIKLYDNEDVVLKCSDDNQTEVMKDVVNYLITEHDLISKITPLPYVPAKKKAIINDQPTYPDGEEEMRLYKELSRGYYLDTHLSGKSKKREINRLTEICELDAQYDGKW